MQRIVTPDKNHDRCNRSSGSLRSQCQWAHIILITLSALVHIISSNDEIVSHIRKCCISGIQYAVKQTNCEKYDYQVTTIPPLWRGLCHSTYGVCCSRKLEEQYCVAGRLAALRGSPCDEQYNTTAFTDCCRGCQVGLAVKASNNDCKNAFFSYFHKMETYHICCDGRRDNYDFFGGIIVDNNDADHVGKERKVNLKTEANNYLNVSEEELEPNMSDELIDNASDGTIVLPVDDGHNVVKELEENKEGDGNERELKGDGIEDNKLIFISNSINKGESMSCSSGYKFDFVNKKCTDIDECANKSDDCKSIDYCHNTVGSYHCLSVNSKKCDPNKEKCENECSAGFHYHHDMCVDIDECAVDEYACDSSQVCNNEIGGYRCDCKIGFNLDITTNACLGESVF
ncbi:fibulin-1-like isoform X2 [Anastrepha ludens]|uniref:fibulin-1-like isoform X2 n=1 Tax=Anastrepha ludens TaxID=28586 RepID=UPI0023AEC29C|nr:fibulin-1-like isoform X2 [Anastrepha ludens]